MKEQPNVKMSVDMGRAFMLAEYPWYDTDMCRSSQGLIIPHNDCPAAEKIKYTLCRHALNCYDKNSKVLDHDSVLELLWFTYGFVPCGVEHKGVIYRILVALRGACWIDKPPIELVDPDCPGYKLLFEQLMRIRASVLNLLSQERQMR
ncbi:hypothetical protein pEaSNUABM37_00038 [Erwinia phage pEa_SNUABM_37]|nr:hypothetical protein pEaSNUABM37_00038 [Erwinia phage pEa_SNUABM_37]QXO10508.1 hypothetical protein pEaSNUABM48_00038 [Erwinia phage pEa_SNUABM_48]